ncbi:MAG: ABC transporter permease [Gemmatimonadales bacterium]
MDRLLQDIRIGFRSHLRTPASSVTAVLVLALGIGLASAVFTVADAVLLRRLPVRDQDRLITIWGETRGQGFTHWPLGFSAARDFARRARSLDGVAFSGYEGAWPVPLLDGGRLSRLRRARVSGEFFDVLGVRPALGRALRAGDDVTGAAPVLVLSHGAWTRQFGGDSAVLGRRLTMHGDGVTFTIVGVMPRGLDYPRGTDFWVPAIPATPPGAAATLQFDLVARLAAGATPAMAREEMTAFLGRADAPAGQRSLRAVVNNLSQIMLGDTKPALLAFAAASALLLVITCINVANLLLVRGLARVREVAVRSALGAGRGRVIAQLLAENTLLAVAGGALGVGVASVAVRAFVAFAPSGVPRLDEIGLNASALAGAVGITFVATLLFALAPALVTSRVELQQVLRSDSRQTATGASRLTTEALVAGQVALALVVLSAAGLIGRSLIRLEGVDLSFNSSGLLIGELALQSGQFDDKQKQLALLERLGAALEAIPGVQAVSPVVAVPYSGTGGWSGRLGADEQTPEEAAANPMLNMEVVTPGYFRTFGIPILQGRGFTPADREGAPPVVLVSQSTARLYWPGQDPIGKRLKLGSKLEETTTVVGVVPDTRYRDLRTALPSIYYPLSQSVFPFAPTVLAIRTRGSPTEMVPSIRRAIGEVAPGAALASIAPFGTFLEAPLAQPRLNAFLLAVFALAAVALAAVGVFGTMATLVRQRAREIGIRLALGATAADVRRMVMRRGLVIGSAGTALGLAGALLTNRLLERMLYDVSATDALTLTLVTGLLLLVATLASLIPAQAGTRIDPMVALRAE